MAELIARSPCGGLLPLTIGELSLTEEPPEPMTLIMPFRGQTGAVSKAMTAAHGLGFPEPGRIAGEGDAKAIWFGRGKAMLVGVEPDRSLTGLAAMSDQSDAWAVVRLTGPQSEAVLARLVPVDLRAPVFGPGQTVQSQVMHMTGSISRIGAQAFRIMVFRSMAATLVHDLKTAMEAVVARR
ncbi:sarcosine oxidase subunit gamma [Seohaeicola saemankumensis]|nr:sarcosine oxidase subunit gamma [Seohaeicola saemankumensis]MCA0869633.1 sarcosine oxidase subunit gamma [Seohaeicola saemankumensis]